MVLKSTEPQPLTSPERNGSHAHRGSIDLAVDRCSSGPIELERHAGPWTTEGQRLQQATPRSSRCVRQRSAKPRRLLHALVPKPSDPPEAINTNHQPTLGRLLRLSPRRWWHRCSPGRRGLVGMGEREPWGGHSSRLLEQGLQKRPRTQVLRCELHPVRPSLAHQGKTRLLPRKRKLANRVNGRPA